jgi:uncharacterized membrane protein YvlD (DUF360 family)
VLVRTAVVLAANAVGLIIAAALLDGVDLDATSFIVAVVIFTVVFALLQPLFAVQLRRMAPRRSAAWRWSPRSRR